MGATARYLVVFALGLGVGLGAVAVASGPSSHQSAADSRIVRQLQRLNGNVEDLGFGVAGMRSELYDTLRAFRSETSTNLKSTNSKLDQANDVLGDKSTFPAGTSLKEILVRICRHTSTIGTC